MRLALSALLLLASAAPALAASAPGPRTLPERQITFSGDAPASISLKNVRGRVVVRGWDRPVLVVRASVHATHALAGEQAKMFEDAAVELTGTPSDGVSLMTMFKRSTHAYPAVLATHGPHVAVDYTLMVPKRSFVAVSQEHGPVVVHGVSGRLSAFSRDGAIAVSAFEGRAEAGNERGEIRFEDVAGDAIGRSQQGDITFKRVTGDMSAASATGEVWVDVSPRFSGDVAFHTIRGTFHSDLATFHTRHVKGDAGWEGVLRGALAGLAAPEQRVRIDTVSGRATVTQRR